MYGYFTIPSGLRVNPEGLSTGLGDTGRLWGKTSQKFRDNHNLHFSFLLRTVRISCNFHLANAWLWCTTWSGATFSIMGLRSRLTFILFTIRGWREGVIVYYSWGFCLWLCTCFCFYLCFFCVCVRVFSRLYVCVYLDWMCLWIYKYVSVEYGFELFWISVWLF